MFFVDKINFHTQKTKETLFLEGLLSLYAVLSKNRQVIVAM